MQQIKNFQVLQPQSRSQYVFLAQIAQQIQREADMLAPFKKIIELNPVLSDQQKKLFIVFSKHVFQKNKWVLWDLDKIIKKEQNNQKNLELLKEHRNKISKEIFDFGKEIIELIQAQLIPKNKEPNSLILYHKIRGDQYKRLFEYNGQKQLNQKATQNEFYTEQMFKSYKIANQLAEIELKYSDPLRLDTNLSLMKYYQQIRHDKVRAHDVGNMTYDLSLTQIVNQTIKEQDYSQLTNLMSIIKDSLTLLRNELYPQQQQG